MNSDKHDKLIFLFNNPEEIKLKSFNGFKSLMLNKVKMVSKIQTSSDIIQILSNKGMMMIDYRDATLKCDMANHERI